MHVLILIFLVLLIFFCILLVYLGYSGLFHRIEVRVKEPTINNFKIAYKFAKGPYKDSYKIYKEVISISPHTRYIAIYYDNPNECRPEERRYLVGTIVSEGRNLEDHELLTKLKQNGFNEWDFPTINYAVVTSFPYKNTTSIYLSAWRVYDAISKYVKNHKLRIGPCVEIWENDFVNYMCPLDHIEDFYVKEINPPLSDDKRDAK